jgi:hypothetical protein
LAVSQLPSFEEQVAALERIAQEAASLEAGLRPEIAAAEARGAVGNQIEATLDGFQAQVMAAIPLHLDTKSMSELKTSLAAAKASALDPASTASHQDRLASLEDTRQKAADALNLFQSVVAVGQRAGDALASIAAKIETMDSNFPGAETAEATAKHTELANRRDTLGKQGITREAVAGLEAIASDAAQQLAAVDAALQREPAKAQVRDQVEPPLKALKRDLDALGTKGGVDVRALDALVQQLDAEVDAACDLADPSAAIQSIIGKIGQAQTQVDAKKTPDANAKIRQEIMEVLVKFGEGMDELKALKFKAPELQRVDNQLAGKLEAAEKIVDAKQQLAKLLPILRDANDALDRADTLLGHARDADSGAQPIDQQKVYRDALEELYGMKIQIPETFTGAHLDKVFEMFAMVPMKFVAHDRLKTLKYDDSERNSGSYARPKATITMNLFPDPESEQYYMVDGQEIPVNSFNVTTLHEIGHSVDVLHGVMTKAMQGAGNGGWKAHTFDEVVPIFVNALKDAARFTTPPQDAVLADTVGNALKAGKVERPESIPESDWAAVQEFLTKRCLTLREGSKPWNADPAAIKVGDRVYHESYSGKWVSYDVAARSSSQVTKYQWRAPGEWFSELFAITWLKKVKPPSAVSGAVLKYLWPPEGS